MYFIFLPTLQILSATFPILIPLVIASRFGTTPKNSPKRTICIRLAARATAFKTKKNKICELKREQFKESICSSVGINLIFLFALVLKFNVYSDMSYTHTYTYILHTLKYDTLKKNVASSAAYTTPTNTHSYNFFWQNV